MRKETNTAIFFSLFSFAITGCGGGGEDLPEGVLRSTNGPLSTYSTAYTIAPNWVVTTGSDAGSINAPSSDFLITVDPLAGTIVLQDVPARYTESWPIGSGARFFVDFSYGSKAYANSGGVLFGHIAMLIPGEASGFDYTTHGTYSFPKPNCVIGDCGTTFYGYSYYFGSISEIVPTSGAGSFSGRMFGSVPIGSSGSTLDGDVTLWVDFGSRKITGSFHDILRSEIGTPNTAIFPDISVNANISGNIIVGSVNGDSGSLRGNFFGSDANELGGVFTTGNVVGSFGATN